MLLSYHGGSNPVTLRGSALLHLQLTVFLVRSLRLGRIVEFGLLFSFTTYS